MLTPCGVKDVGFCALARARSRLLRRLTFSRLLLSEIRSLSSQAAYWVNAGKQRWSASATDNTGLEDHPRLPAYTIKGLCVVSWSDLLKAVNSAIDLASSYRRFPLCGLMQLLCELTPAEDSTFMEHWIVVWAVSLENRFWLFCFQTWDSPQGGNMLLCFVSWLWAPSASCCSFLGASWNDQTRVLSTL